MKKITPGGIGCIYNTGSVRRITSSSTLCILEKSLGDYCFQNFYLKQEYKKTPQPKPVFEDWVKQRKLTNDILSELGL